MRMTMSGLPPLVEENQNLLGQLILMSMHAYGFKVDGVRIEFVEDDE